MNREKGVHIWAPFLILNIAGVKYLVYFKHFWEPGSPQFGEALTEIKSDGKQKLCSWFISLIAVGLQKSHTAQLLNCNVNFCLTGGSKCRLPS